MITQLVQPLKQDGDFEATDGDSVHLVNYLKELDAGVLTGLRQLCRVKPANPVQLVGNCGVSLTSMGMPQQEQT